MTTPKQFLHHELLNICTFLALTLEEDELSHEQKEHMRQYINALQLLVEHESVLLGEQPSFFLGEYLLKELVEMALIGHENIINTRKVIITLDSTLATHISTDRHYFEVALKYLLQKILQKTSFVDFSFDSQKKIFTISHDAKFSKNILQKNLKDMLQKENLHNGELMYQLGLFFFSQYKKEPNISQNTFHIFC